jgi:UDP-N-acetyl-D-mannosaminuronate dehydrogenase
MKFKSICVLGLGYIGLPTASAFAAHGIKVALLFDTNSGTITPGSFLLHGEESPVYRSSLMS